MAQTLKIVECPRDAMQGIAEFIPTPLKIRYLRQLLKVGFDTLDFGSFVSPKAVPQLRDTAEVLAALEPEESGTKLLAIVANLRGAEEACRYPAIDYLGYPFSISETFQQRNTRRSMRESLALVQEMQALSERHGKALVVYLSMAFGNPYGDPWSPDLAAHWAGEIAAVGVRTLALADTVGVSTPEAISRLFTRLQGALPAVEFGGHFHAHPADRKAKIEAAYAAGCRRFDTALQGFGGCPFAEDELVGNIATESLLEFCAERAIDPGIDCAALAEALTLAGEVFQYR